MSLYVCVLFAVHSQSYGTVQRTDFGWPTWIHSRGIDYSCCRLYIMFWVLPAVKSTKTAFIKKTSCHGTLYDKKPQVICHKYPIPLLSSNWTEEMMYWGKKKKMYVFRKTGDTAVIIPAPARYIHWPPLLSLASLHASCHCSKCHAIVINLYYW